MTGVTPYLTGWEAVLTEPGDVRTFRRGDFTLHLHGTHEVRLTGRGIDKDLRFYWAALEIMRLDDNEENDRH